MTKNGGPAFPRPASIDHTGASALAKDGMSLRDYFAGQALVRCSPLRTEHGIDGVVALAYKLADAMLKEREK